jgi:hypothetical integral membrane protein (TIGR02206 family)
VREIIGSMPNYGAAHWAMLALLVALVAVCVPLARRIRGTEREVQAYRWCGWALLVWSIGWWVWGMLPENWNPAESLPLHYSDALRLIAAFALITRRPFWLALLFFWGLTLNLQAVITPSLNYYVSPVVEFVDYWSFHLLVQLAAIVIVWGYGYRPSWREYWWAFGSAMAWAVVAGVGNVISGANYGFLAHKPPTASALDAMPEWPWYVPILLLLVGGVWALMTWPFARGRGKLRNTWETTNVTPDTPGTIRRNDRAAP